MLITVVAWVILLHEIEVQDEHVESVWRPCLDEGSSQAKRQGRAQNPPAPLFTLNKVK